MNKYIRSLVLIVLIVLIALCLQFLLQNNTHEAIVFVAQSVLDNAIFCIMFILVVLITGINC